MSEEIKIDNVARLDHLGIAAGMMQDIGLKEMIDGYIGVDNQELLSTGEIISGMILNGLGFVSKPLMLFPEFFANKPVDILISEAANAELFNRHRLGRALDAVDEFGCEKLFDSIAFEAAQREGVDMRFVHNDTTSLAVTGTEYKECDVHEFKLAHGYSKDYRPDLKQLVQELLVSQDGGIPLAAKTWSGNASDTKILQQRAEEMLASFKAGGSWCFVADSKLYAQQTAKSLNEMRFITRVPATLSSEKAAVRHALINEDAWIKGEKGYKFQEQPSDQYQINNQRFIIVSSEQARIRSEATLKRHIVASKTQADRILKKLQKELYNCEDDAKKALTSFEKKLKYHCIETKEIVPEQHPNRPGRLTKNTIYVTKHKIKATLTVRQQLIDSHLNELSCFVLATNVPSSELSPEQVLINYKGQDKVEKGFAFLKSPNFFASSIFLKKPQRIQALLMIMTLSLLVYTLAQRRLRKNLEEANETIPNQIKKPTQKPTLHWVFQLFEGVNIVSISFQGVKKTFVQGLTALRLRILSFFGSAIQRIYFSYPATG
jgi:transposase